MKHSSIIAIPGTILVLLLLIGCNKQEKFSNIQKLEILGKTWGLMKYHHPEIGETEINWDSVFINHFAIIDSATNKQQFNVQLKGLINSVDINLSVHKSQQCDSLNSEKLVDFEWLESDYLSEENRSYLKDLISQKMDYRNKYVSDSVGSRSLGYARFYEDPMENADLEQIEIRVLGLFRYWNIIEYYFPYKNLIDKKWSDVLTEYIPQFINASNKEEYYECLLRLSTEINDGHANIPYHPELRSQFFGMKTVPFTMKIVDNKLVINSIKSDSLSQLAGIKIGDIINEVNGESIEKRMAYLSNYLSKPNSAFQNSEISRYVLNGNSDSLMLNISRDSQTFNLRISRYSFSDIRKYRDSKDVSPWTMFDDGIGYAHMEALNTENLQDFFKEIEMSKALILDFREYPNWEILNDFLSYFYVEVKPFVLLKSQCLQKPGTYYWHFSENDVSSIKPSQSPYKKPIIILVDENTLSFGEYFVMALQTLENVTVIGSQTAGEDGNQVGIEMPGGMRMFMSSLGIYYPNGDVSQRAGLKIDEIITLTIDDVKYNTDTALNQALINLRKVVSK